MAQQRKSLPENHHEPSRLEELRKKLTPLQQKLLNEFWQHYKKDAKWPLSRSVHSRYGKQKVRECFKDLGGDVVHEGQDSALGGRCYELTIIGILITDAGRDYFSMLARYLEFLRTQYKEVPERTNFSDKDFREGLNLSDEQAKILGGLVRLGRLWNGGGYGSESWNIQVPDDIEDLPENGPLDQALEELLFRWFQEGKPVSIDERQKLAPTILAGNYLNRFEAPGPSTTPVTIDALKRRYQVFVSSTYEDLKEERQHVIQALLETKCIPLGMELFPAASVEQWALIKRVIDECDYYLVIVAGRYGSLSESKIGYTEMEFDYAMSIGKPVIGFYHKSPENLPGTKLEKNDDGRERLKSFTEKIKKKLCRPWNSSAELGSAVKSAILHELEFNPKPGWIRADIVPSSDTVEKLKQKIADLEEKVKKQKGSVKNSFPEGQELFSIPIKVEYDFQTVKIYKPIFGEIEREQPQKHFDLELQITWDDLVFMLQKNLQSGNDLAGLERTIHNSIRDRLLPAAISKIGNDTDRFDYSLPNAKVELILKTLMAKKLIKMISGYGGSWSNPYWRFTPRGLQYSAELQAVKSSK